jgi:hypothetical protein
VADLSKVRIEHEIETGPELESSCAQVENIALKREVRRLEKEHQREIQRLEEENHRLSHQTWWERLWSKSSRRR